MSTASLTVTLAGAPQDIFVSTGWLRSRQTGPTLALLTSSAASAPAPGSPATITLTSSAGVVTTFSGTVRRAIANPGNELLVVSFVGGAGGLTQTLPPDPRRDGGSAISAALVASAICSDAGEVLDAVAAQALGMITIPRWHRASDVTAARSLDELAAYLTSVTPKVPWYWRVLPSGAVWIGQEVWTPNDSAAYWMDLDEDDGGVWYAPDGGPLAVGQSIDGVRAIDVTYYFTEEEVTAYVRGPVPGDPVRGQDLYSLAWPATVVAQHADGTVDVTCDDPRMGDLLSLPAVSGWPGAVITLDMTQPTRCRVRFAGGSPAGGFAESFEQDPTASLPVALATGFLAAHVTDGGFVGLYYSATAAPSAAWVIVPSGPLPPTSLTSGLAITVPSAQVRLR